MKKQTSKIPAVDECWLISAAAVHLGIPHNTLDCAVKAGNVRSFKTACGRVVVTLADVQEYLNNRPERGWHSQKRNKQ